MPRLEHVDAQRLERALARVERVVDDADRKSTRLNSSYTVIYTLSLHDALPISILRTSSSCSDATAGARRRAAPRARARSGRARRRRRRSEEHTSELQLHSDLHSFPTRRSSDLDPENVFVVLGCHGWSTSTRSASSARSLG